MVMAAATAEDFEVLIRTLEISEFKILFHQMMEFLTKKSVYGDEFGAGADRFAEACRNIVTTPNAGRLGKLIKVLFEDAKKLDLLEPRPDAAAACAIVNGDAKN